MLTTLNKISLPTKDPWKRKWISAKKTKTAATKNSDPEKWKQKLKRKKTLFNRYYDYYIEYKHYVNDIKQNITSNKGSLKKKMNPSKEN